MRIVVWAKPRGAPGLDHYSPGTAHYARRGTRDDKTFESAASREPPPQPSPASGGGSERVQAGEAAKPVRD
jgi:hypothetical protein